MRICFLMIILIFAAPVVVHSATQSNEPPQRKSHKWLIPVGAGVGFGLGLLLGFRAYDEAINSDQKIWTSAIVGGAIGGIGGWVASRRMDRGSHSFVWPAQSIEEKITKGIRADARRRRVHAVQYYFP